ncbi:hypothetical protein RB213_002687 [Colletotrichum asianum]
MRRYGGKPGANVSTLPAERLLFCLELGALHGSGSETPPAFAMLAARLYLPQRVCARLPDTLWGSKHLPMRGKTHLPPDAPLLLLSFPLPLGYLPASQPGCYREHANAHRSHQNFRES